MTDITTRLQELQETIRRAQAEIDDLRKTPMQKAVEAFCNSTDAMIDLTDEEIAAGLRAAWPHLKAVMANDDWIPWSGGACPVPKDVHVNLRLRSGTTTCGARAGGAIWKHTGVRYDIVAYKVCNH